MPDRLQYADHHACRATSSAASLPGASAAVSAALAADAPGSFASAELATSTSAVTSATPLLTAPPDLFAGVLAAGTSMSMVVPHAGPVA